MLKQRYVILSMHSKYMANVPTYLMSGVWTFGIGFTFVKIEIIV